MAGRNYNVSSKVPLPQSEEVTEKSKQSFLEHLMYDDDFDDEDLDDDTKPVFSPSLQLRISIILVVAAVTTILVYFVAIVRYDYQNGAGTSNELVTEVTTQLDHFNYEDMKTYLPRTMRSEGFVADSDEFAKFRELCDEDGYKLKNSAIVSETPFSDIAQLEQGLFDVYHKKEHIIEAKLVQTDLLFTNLDGTSLRVTVNLIPIKILHKWYLYMGDDVLYEDEPLVFLSIHDDSKSDGSSVTDISYVDKPEEIETEQVEVIPLDFYENAKADLISGACIINDIDRTLPGLFSAFEDVFTLDKNKLPASQSLTLAQDEILGNLPIVFTNEIFKDTGIYVSVANLSRDTVLIQDASVTTLCISKGSVPVVLPGNVTFGTSFSDIVKMYGDLQKTDDTQFQGTLSDDVYSLDLGNHRNHIYFGFKDGKLIEIQWFYIDMTNYRGI